MGHYIGRCISAVHIKRCSAGIRRQWFEAKWLWLSVTVRVRARESFPLFFLSVSVNVTDIVCCALLACIVNVRLQYDVIGHEVW